MSDDKNRKEGSAKSNAEKAKKGFGKATGDQKSQAGGKAQQGDTKGQDSAGSAKAKDR